MDKTHIEHTVCLIKDEYLDIRERDISLAHEIEETTRSCYQDVHTMAESLSLLSLSHSAEYDCLMESGISTIRAKTLFDLDGKFTCWSEDEGFDFSLSFGRILFLK